MLFLFAITLRVSISILLTIVQSTSCHCCFIVLPFSFYTEVVLGTLYGSAQDDIFFHA